MSENVVDFLSARKNKTEPQQRKLEGMLLTNILSTKGTEYFMFNSLPHDEVIKSFIPLFCLPSVINFVYQEGEGTPDYNVVTIICEKYPMHEKKYVIRTFFGPENYPITTIHNEYEGFCTLNPNAIGNYLEDIVNEEDKQVIAMIDRHIVPKFDYSDFPNSLKITGMKETLTMRIPFDRSDTLSDTFVNLAVSKYFQMCLGFQEDDIPEELN